MYVCVFHSDSLYNALSSVYPHSMHTSTPLPAIQSALVIAHSTRRQHANARTHIYERTQFLKSGNPGSINCAASSYATNFGHTFPPLQSDAHTHTHTYTVAIRRELRCAIDYTAVTYHSHTEAATKKGGGKEKWDGRRRDADYEHGWGEEEGRTAPEGKKRVKGKQYTRKSWTKGKELWKKISPTPERPHTHTHTHRLSKISYEYVSVYVIQQWVVDRKSESEKKTGEKNIQITYFPFTSTRNDKIKMY